MSLLQMQDLDLSNKRVLIREDLNVPLKNGQITNAARILAALPTLKAALKKGAAVIVVSHLGRPTEGAFDADLSLAPIADRLSQELAKPVQLIKDWENGFDIAPGDIGLLENIRFQAGEKANTPELSQKLANLCDIFVMDAFGTAHRTHASTVGVAELAPIACAGPLLSAELSALNQAMKNPARPLVAIVGGAKVSSKLGVLKSLIIIVSRFYSWRCVYCSTKFNFIIIFSSICFKRCIFI